MQAKEGVASSNTETHYENCTLRLHALSGLRGTPDASKITSLVSQGGTCLILKTAHVWFVRTAHAWFVKTAHV